MAVNSSAANQIGVTDILLPPATASVITQVLFTAPDITLRPVGVVPVYVLVTLSIILTV